jgi:copper(I)-binding protein
MNRRFFLLALTHVAAVTSLPVSAHEFYASGFTIVHPWAMPAEAGAATAAIYLRFDDVGEADRLVSAHSDTAARVALVDATGLDASAPPRPLAGFDLVAGSPAELQAGGAYLQLQQLGVPLVAGRSYPLTLVFERSKVITTTFFVEFPR